MPSAVRIPERVLVPSRRKKALNKKNKPCWSPGGDSALSACVKSGHEARLGPVVASQMEKHVLKNDGDDAFHARTRCSKIPSAKSLRSCERRCSCFGAGTGGWTTVCLYVLVMGYVRDCGCRVLSDGSVEQKSQIKICPSEEATLARH